MGIYKRWEKGDRQGRLVLVHWISGFCGEVACYVIGWFWGFAFFRVDDLLKLDMLDGRR